MNSLLKLITKQNIVKGVLAGVFLIRSKTLNIPIAVNYDLTWQCNLRCKHCYFYSSAENLGKTSLNERRELSDEQWIKIFKYHKNLGILSVALTGGEPTLRMNLLHEAVNIFPAVQIASNGIIKLPRFKSRKQPIYWVSLDGSKETHNAIRGAKIFDKVIENIQNDKRVLISTTVTSMNYNEIDKVVKIAYESGVSGLFFLWYSGYPNDPLLLKGEILKKAAKNVLKVMKDYGDFILISKKLLELYMTKEFTSNCPFKSNGVVSFYPNGQKKYCVIGNSPDLCANCGCIVPVASHALMKFDIETIDKLSKFPF